MRYAIAGGVSQPVVDLVQVIDIDHDEREVERVAPRPLELIAQAPVERIKRRTPGQLVGRARADLAAVHRRAALFVLEHAGGRLRDRVGERDVLRAKLRITFLGPQEEHSGRASLHEHRQRHRRLHVDLDLLLAPMLANRGEQRMIVHVLDHDGAFGADGLLDFGVAAEVDAEIADGRILVHGDDATFVLARCGQHERAMRESERLAHATHQSLKDFVRPQRR